MGPPGESAQESGVGADLGHTVLDGITEVHTKSASQLCRVKTLDISVHLQRTSESQNNTSCKYQGFTLQLQPSWMQGAGSRASLLRNHRMSTEMSSASCPSGLFYKETKVQRS